MRDNLGDRQSARKPGSASRPGQPHQAGGPAAVRGPAGRAGPGRRAAGAAGPLAPGLGVLSTLAESGPLTQIELATTMSIDRTAMVYLLDELEERSLVQRVRHPRDRRAFLIHLTAGGQDLQRRAAAALAGAAGTLLTPLDPAERRTRRLAGQGRGSLAAGQREPAGSRRCRGPPSGRRCRGPPSGRRCGPSRGPRRRPLMPILPVPTPPVPSGAGFVPRAAPPDLRQP